MSIIEENLVETIPPSVAERIETDTERHQELERGMDVRRLKLSDGTELMVVPWEEEPLHRSLKRTNWCIVYEARLPPGATTLWHFHSRNTVYACIHDGSEKGKPVVSTAVNDLEDGLKDPVEFEVARGDSFCMWHADKTFMHQVHSHPSNLSTTIFLGVEALRFPSVRGSLQNLECFQYKMSEDRGCIKVWRLVLPPGVYTGEHELSAPSVFVALSNGILKANQANKNIYKLDSKCTSPFQEHYSPGEFHIIEGPVSINLQNKGSDTFVAMFIQWCSEE